MMSDATTVAMLGPCTAMVRLTALVWVKLYAELRALHSLIHVTCNRVVHRFAAYAASTLLLFGMWGAFALDLAGA